MQATLDIDDDVLQAVETMSRKQRRTVGELLSELARRALGTSRLDPSVGNPLAQNEFGFRPFPKRGGEVSDDLINRLREGDCY